MSASTNRRVLIQGKSEYNPLDVHRVHVTIPVYEKRYQAKGYVIVSYSDGEEYLTPEEIQKRKDAAKKAAEKDKAPSADDVPSKP